jgi:hypothetical protein
MLHTKLKFEFIEELIYSILKMTDKYRCDICISPNCFDLSDKLQTIKVSNLKSGEWSIKVGCGSCIGKLKYYNERGAYYVISKCDCCKYEGVIFVNPRGDKVCVNCYGV